MPHLGRLVIGYWDCPYCDTKGIRGDKAACPNCGRRRGNVRFYLKGQAQDHELRPEDTKDLEYVIREKEKYVNRNPDWYCSFCDTLNSDNAETCQGCGASRSDSDTNYFQMLEKLKEKEQAQAPPAPKAPARRSRLPLILIDAVLIMAGFFLFMNGRVTSGDYRIAGVSWERAVQISQNRLYHESGWSVPPGASVTGESSEIHHYDNVIDHYEDREVQRSRQVVDHYETYYTYTDLGNGMFDQAEHQRPVYATEYYTVTERQPVYRQVPRYQTRYTYDIRRWTPERTATAEGRDQIPYWPETNLKPDEREEDRTEAYYVEILNTKNNETVRYSLSQADWRTLRPGDQVYITANRFGEDVSISDEKGNPLIRLVRK